MTRSTRTTEYKSYHAADGLTAPEAVSHPRLAALTHAASRRWSASGPWPAVVDEPQPLVKAAAASSQDMLRAAILPLNSSYCFTWYSVLMCSGCAPTPGKAHGSGGCERATLPGQRSPGRVTVSMPGSLKAERFSVTFVVMTGGTDWAVVAPAILGAIGVGTFAGAVVTTYGGRGRERREARSKALGGLEER